MPSTLFNGASCGWHRSLKSPTGMGTGRTHVHCSSEAASLFGGNVMTDLDKRMLKLEDMKQDVAALKTSKSAIPRITTSLIKQGWWEERRTPLTEDSPEVKERSPTPLKLVAYRYLSYKDESIMPVLKERHSSPN